MSKLERGACEAGFTIVEIMVVVIIIGMLATIVATNVVSRQSKAQVVKAQMQIRVFGDSLDLFKLDVTRYPTEEEGLEALVEDPGVDSWGPESYIKTIPADPWGNDYVYIYDADEDTCDVISYGKDGKEGGDKYNLDIMLSTLGAKKESGD